MSRRNWQPEKVKKMHVIRAASIWKKRATPFAKGHPFFQYDFRQSTHYDVLIDGKAYPPKAIASCAHGLATDNYLNPSDFAGAKDGVWHRLFESLGFHVVEKGLHGGANATSDRKRVERIANDIQDIIDSDLPSTTRQLLIEARIGQGEFRKAVLANWDHGCAVTGCKTVAALRASHIKPWRKSNDDERLDPENGLPLIATLDALFDRHLISFTNSGRIVISKSLEKDLESMGIKRTMELQGRLSNRQKQLLAEHRRSLV